MKPHQTVVLDTNVLLEDSQAIDSYEKMKIVIPFQVIEELDKHKSAPGQLGGNARAAIRALEKASHGTRVLLRQWGQEEQVELEARGMAPTPDNLIIATALAIKGCMLVSNDLAVRLKGKSFGLKVQAHVRDTKTNSIADIYSGLGRLEISEEAINGLYAQGSMGIPKKLQLLPNQYLHLQSITNDKHTAIGRVVEGKIVRVEPVKECFSIKPRGLEQVAVFDALLDPSLSLVSLLGRAGCGKTLLATAAALEMVLHTHVYNKIIVIRSPTSVGEGVGFLPGSLAEKVLPYFLSIYDAFEVIFKTESQQKLDMIVQGLIDDGRLEFAPTSFLRGRSLPKTIVLVEESQNLSIHETKTIATRLGEGSKLVMIGDLNQIDHPKLDALSGGFAKIIENFKNEACSAHITLNKTERSSFAALAAELL